MLFVAPVWLSILVPIAVALALLGASVVIRQWRPGAGDKAAFLAIAGLALAFVLGGPVMAAALAALVLFTHRIAWALEHEASRRRRDRTRGPWPARVRLVVAVAVPIATIAAISRTHAVVGPLQSIGGTLMPFGLSYFAFHGISYVVDVYRRRAPAERSRLQLAVYLMLLPLIVGGPLAYEGVARQLARRLPSLSDYSYGVRRLLLGVWKVFVMAGLAGAQADAAFARPAVVNAFAAWLGVLCFSLQIYYAFSGYSDMGVGLGRMLGIRLPENFRWPYVAETIRDFWRRWHIGLVGWFRDYADPSLEPDHVPPPSAGREVLVVLLCAVWYGAGWTFVVWGLYHAALVMLERSGVEAAVKRLPAILRHAYVVAAVLVGWVILRSGTPAGALLYLEALAGLNPSASGVQPAMTLELWFLLVGGAMGCAPLFPTIRRWTVAIDALIVSLLMMLFASLLFAWRGVRIVAMPVIRTWRWSLAQSGRRGPGAL